MPDVSKQNATQSAQANAFNSGDLIKGKIAGVKLVATPNSGGKLVATMKREDEMVFLGEEMNGFLKVQGADGEGWADKRFAVKS